MARHDPHCWDQSDGLSVSPQTAARCRRLRRASLALSLSLGVFTNLPVKSVHVFICVSTYFDLLSAVQVSAGSSVRRFISISGIKPSLTCVFPSLAALQRSRRKQRVRRSDSRLLLILLFEMCASSPVVSVCLNRGFTSTALEKIMEQTPDA